VTYDPEDIANGLIRTALDRDPSMVGRLTRRLDYLTDVLMAQAAQGHVEPEVKGEARGVAYALSLCTCYSDEEVREQIMLRYHDRHGDDADPRPAPSQTGRKRKRASAT
jgi:hypothetical protein